MPQELIAKLESKGKYWVLGDKEAGYILKDRKTGEHLYRVTKNGIINLVETSKYGVTLKELVLLNELHETLKADQMEV